MASTTRGPVGEERTRGRKSWTDEQSVFWYRVGQILFHLIFRYWVQCFTPVAANTIPSQGAGFLIANHTSAMDPFIVCLPVRQRLLRGPGKIELFKHPIVSWLMRRIGIFPLRRDGVDTAAMRTMLELYRSGSLIVIFPEGGRSLTSELLPFDIDFARLVIKLKAPLFPAGIAGASHLLPIGAYLPRPHTPVAVVYGEMFTLERYYGREMTVELAEEAAAYMRERVHDMVEQARAVMSC
jgi:1-acyl-sn-glycerol-3-phosphate acyltransferase